jgi:hypothetical protein
MFWMTKGDPERPAPSNDEHIMAREALLRLKLAMRRMHCNRFNAVSGLGAHSDFASVRFGRRSSGAILLILDLAICYASCEHAERRITHL